MQSPPTLPRRRGRLQPDPICCGLVIDGLTPESSANMSGRSFARPGVERSAAESSPSLAQEGYIFCALSKFLAASSPVGSTNAKNDGCGRLVAGIGYLRLPASRTSV